MTNCGDGHESCCTSLLVLGGTYDRTFDPVGPDGGIEVGDGGDPVDLADPATISTFRLDQYEVTVGRWRQFNRVWDGGTGGYVPATGSGKHTHLNGGLGLANSAAAGTYETGWTVSDSASLAPAQVTSSNTGCPTLSTWTDTPEGNDKLPMNCVTWYEAYAFCIWDGGFLPSEAEWEYAAAGGNQQREYSWGDTPPGTANQYAIYGTGTGIRYYPTKGECDLIPAPVGTSLLGAGRWGQLDLEGNETEWTLDVGSNTEPPDVNLDPKSYYVDPCTDCAYLGMGNVRVFRGASFYDGISALVVSEREGAYPALRHFEVGFRCARSP